MAASPPHLALAVKLTGQAPSAITGKSSYHSQPQTTWKGAIQDLERQSLIHIANGWSMLHGSFIELWQLFPENT
jgi:hypothetical protein